MTNTTAFNDEQLAAECAGAAFWTELPRAVRLVISRATVTLRCPPPMRFAVPDAPYEPLCRIDIADAIAAERART